MAKRRKRKRRAKKTAAAKPSASWLDHTRRLPGTLAEILKLSPAQFEEGVADLLQRLGYRSVQRAGRSGDLGVDITCQDNEGRSVVVQCKQYTGARIGSKDIQTFIGMQSIHHKADRGMFVTTSEFTRPAQNLAERHGITLIDDKALINHVRQAYRGQKTTPDAGEAATDTGRERGVVVCDRAPFLGPPPWDSDDSAKIDEENKAYDRTIIPLIRDNVLQEPEATDLVIRIGVRRRKLIRLIPTALENYANRPHDPERVVVNEIPNDIFTGRRSDVKRWLQVALDDLHLERHVVLYVPTTNDDGEVVPEGVRVPRLEVCTEWKPVHEGVRRNTLLVWLVEAPEVEHNPQSGAISFDAL